MRRCKQGSTESGCRSSSKEDALEKEVEPAGFSKASEVTRCTSAEEGGMEEPLEWEGHGLQAEEALQQRWHLEDRAQDGSRGSALLLQHTA